MHSPQISTPDSTGSSNGSAADTYLFSRTFPFTPVGDSGDIQEIIYDKLPPFPHAMLLCEAYFDQLSWLFRGLTRQQLCAEMLPAIYNRHPEEYSGPHDLALVFIIFSLGYLVQDNAAEAGHFHQVSLAALSLQPVLEKPSIVTIQTLHLISIYNSMGGSESEQEDTSMELTWSLVTMAAHLGQNVRVTCALRGYSLNFLVITRLVCVS